MCRQEPGGVTEGEHEPSDLTSVHHIRSNTISCQFCFPSAARGQNAGTGLQGAQRANCPPRLGNKPRGVLWSPKSHPTSLYSLLGSFHSFLVLTLSGLKELTFAGTYLEYTQASSLDLPGEALLSPAPWQTRGWEARARCRGPKKGQYAYPGCCGPKTRLLQPHQCCCLLPHFQIKTRQGMEPKRPTLRNG